jgi:hypothetical protein
VVENKREQFVHRPSLGFVVKLEPLGVMNNIVTAKLSFHGEAGLKEAPVKAKDLVIVYTMLLIIRLVLLDSSSLVSTTTACGECGEYLQSSAAPLVALGIWGIAAILSSIML